MEVLPGGTGELSKVDDGLVDVFVLGSRNLKTLTGAADRVLHLDSTYARDTLRQGKEISIDTVPDQPVWTDGEYTGRTPI